MLAPKKPSAKKMKLYLAALAVIFIGLAFILFKNLFTASQPGLTLPAETNTSLAPAADNVLDNELDFISTGKWQNLRSNVETTDLPVTGNNNPFAAKK
ncbi:MAG: hypothetical protein WCV41_01700 [Patescibacteria group bacterium]